MFRTLLISGLVVFSSTVFAAKPGTEEPAQATGYLGHTTASFDGGATMQAMYAACQADFAESEAVVCSTKQLFESPSFATLTIQGNTRMWARPFIVSAPGTGQAEYVVTDYSGETRQPVYFTWCEVNTSGSALAITDKGKVDIGSCGTPLPAACCR